MADKASLHLDEKWDKLIDLSLRRTTYGLIIGGVASLLLFRTSPGARTALTSFAVGAGAGSAFQLCSSEFETLVPTLLRK